MKRAALTAGMMVAVAAPEARAHFVLQSPAAYSTQNSSGSPQKSAPCGQADGGAIVPTGAVTSYHSGDSVTVTIDERIYHPGHYRVALAADLVSLPADPIVTPDSDSPCGTAQIQSASTQGVLVDNMLPHTAPFSGPQSFRVTLPAGLTCTNCTLQVIEFMSSHPLNDPGGCFYHHCAQLNIVPPGTPLPENPPGDAGSDATGGVRGGCSAGGSPGGALGLAGLGLILQRRRRGRRAQSSRPSGA